MVSAPSGVDLTDALKLQLAFASGTAAIVEVVPCGAAPSPSEPAAPAGLPTTIAGVTLTPGRSSGITLDHSSDLAQEFVDGITAQGLTPADVTYEYNVGPQDAQGDIQVARLTFSGGDPAGVATLVEPWMAHQIYGSSDSREMEQNGRTLEVRTVGSRYNAYGIASGDTIWFYVGPADGLNEFLSYVP
jgi:hypothetical protein